MNMTRTNGAKDLPAGCLMSKAETTRYGYVAESEALVKRLRRIEGQVRGIKKMVEAERYRIDILTQIAAANIAHESVAFKVLDDRVNHRVTDALASGDAEVAAEKSRELLDGVQRFARTR